MVRCGSVPKPCRRQTVPPESVASTPVAYMIVESTIDSVNVHCRRNRRRRPARRNRVTTRRFYYKQNRLKQLRAFCHAVRTRSISKAAERVHLSQPSVSLQIKALEQEMGTVLFERRGPRIALTPEGPRALRARLAAGRRHGQPARRVRRALRKPRHGRAPHRGRRVDDPLPAAGLRGTVRGGVPGHRDPAAQRHRPRGSRAAARRQRGLRGGGDVRCARRHHLPADLHVPDRAHRPAPPPPDGPGRRDPRRHRSPTDSSCRPGT